MSVSDNVTAIFSSPRYVAEALADTIGRLFQRDAPATTADETDELIARRRNAVDAAARFKTGSDRRSVVETCREMYESDPRAKKILQTLARDATKGGFQLITEDQEALDVAEELRARLKLDNRLDDWCRLTVRDGDTFLELGVSAALDIERVTRKPTLSMYRNSNKSDRFDDPARAFYYSDKPWLVRPDANTIWFAEWQIIHARWDHDEGNRYGRPLMKASMDAWKRVKEGEIDIAVRRKTRAGMKYFHQIEGDNADVERYKAMNQDALDNPLAAIADFFFNQRVNVTTVQGDARLGEIDDVKHHIKTFWMPSPAPMDLLGYGEDVDFSVIGHQKEQYDESLEAVREWVTDQFIAPLLERQWLLKGIFPDDVDYEIKFAPKQQVTADSVEKIARAAAQLRALGVSEEVIGMLLAQFIPGLDPEMLFAATAPEGDSVERLANITRTLMRSFDAR